MPFDIFWPSVNKEIRRAISKGKEDTFLKRGRGVGGGRGGK